MNEQSEPLPPEPPALEAPPTVTIAPRKGWTKLAWIVIVAEVGAIIAFRMLGPVTTSERAQSVAARMDLKVMQLQMQLLMAARGIAQGANPRDLFASAEKTADGDPAKALRLSALAADLIGPKEALKQVDEARQAEDKLTPELRRLIDVLWRLYGDQERGEVFHPSVSDDEAAFVEAQLGWAGTLALHPLTGDETLQRAAAAAGARGPALLEQYHEGRQRVVDAAMTTLIVVIVFGSVALLLVGAGFTGLPLFLLLWLIGVLRVGLKPGIAHGGVYAETFALWMLLYVGLLFSSEVFLRDVVPIAVRGSIAMPISLVVVAWPVLRGVPWRQVRQDIGWTMGRSPLLEPACGLVCYVVNLPVMVAGFLLMVILATIYAALQTQAGGGTPAPPSHPAVEQLGHMDWLNTVLFFFLLSVVAPVVEETMFRGFLHRQLREVLFLRYPLLGGVCTAFIVNVIFAAVHPQGLLFIPVLGSLACAFSLAREWRGTLIPAMVAHGTSNFLVGLLAVLLFGR
jgi:membrane protease YdiL (CAAX protease family)